MKEKTISTYQPFRQLYFTQIREELKKELQYSSIMQVPRLEKIILSMGLGDAIQNKNFLTQAVQELTLIAGQKAIRTKAKKSIAAFKVRKGMEIGVKVVLRDHRMYDFLYRLVHIALPRTRDFRGLSMNSFDGHGNYSLGIEEHIVFPEIDYDTIERISGLNVTFVTTARTDEEAYTLLKKFNMPFRKE